MASYIEQVSSLGPSVWYRFNETAGTPVNFGALTTTGTFTSLLLNEQTDVDGRATYFDGANANIKLNAWPSFSLFDDKSFTIETWFKLATQDSSDRTMYRFSGSNPVGSTLRIESLGSANANSGKLKLSITGLGEQVADRETYSTNTYFDTAWHHVVVAVNTTSLKWYIDGNLEATKTLTSGTLNWDNYTSGSNLSRLIGASRSNTSETISTVKYRGWLDEFAIYNYELNSTQVLANFNAGASVNFPVGANTASASLPLPAWSVETVLPADPMTASALFVETFPSNFDYVDGIQKIISDFGPETWFKFDYVTDYSTTTPTYITNYGSGGSITYTGGQYPDVNQIGPAQEPSVQLEIGSSSNHITSTSSALFTTEISDSNFSIGIWFKVPTGIDTSEKQIFAYNGPTNSPLSLKINNKKLVYSIQTSHTTYSHTTTADISEDVWHLAVLKLDLANTTIKYYLDGTEVYSETAIQGNRATPTTFSLGKSSGNGTDTGAKRLTLAHYFVDTYSDVTPTIITNLYNAGTRQNQAKGVMRQPVLKFLNKYDDTVQALNPLIQLGLNEVSGTVVENIGSSTGGTFSVVGSNYTRGPSILTKNRYGYNFTNKNTYVAGQYATATNTFSDNTKTVSVYAKINTVTGSDLQIIHFDGGSGGAFGIGLSLLANASGPLLAIIATANPATWGTISAGTSYFGDYHLYTMVRDGSSVKLYIDGKQVGNTLTYSSYNLTDSGFTATGGGETVWFAQSAATVNKFVDEVAVFDYALSNQQIFEMWQSIEIDRATSNSEFVMPTNIAGTGNIQTASPMTASAEAVMPTQTDEINNSAVSFDAFAEFLLPNFGGNVVIDANYGHEAFTASAVFHEPQTQIGDIHTADHMDANALMVHPAAIAAGSIAVSTAVGSATFVMPGIVAIKGARIFADPMRAQSLFPLPPAYIQLADDPWFVRLYEAHADRKTEPKQATIAPGGESTDIIKGGFLSFFDDHLSDRSPTSSPNTITSELPAYFFSPISSTGATDTTKATTAAIAPRQSTSPAPLLAIAGQDNQERKAVRVNNIEFVLPGTSKNFSERYYNLEFSIKTTKADQVLSYGQFESFQNYGSRIGVIGLSDGKIYLATDDSSPLGTSLSDLRRNIPSTAPHPKNLSATNAFGYFQGRNNIADGEWHHVIIQRGWTDGRTQIWVDGNLDRQIGVLNELGGTGYASFAGSNGTNEIRPYILGFNSNDPILYSDFTISAWNFYPGRFLEQRDISLNYTAYGKWEPIKAEPMTATARVTDNNRAAGNRARALMLYFWPVERQLGTSKSLTSTDNGQFGGFDEPTFETFLTNVDRIEYQGWDLFPVDVIGTRVSPMIKPEVWGGYGYRDQVTGAPRYLDLVNDIDLSLFDAIFFRNFPEQTEELDEYVRQEFSDTYFNVKEEDLYENFLTSLRAAVDQGLSLYITNSKLALDLGIVDRVEVISDIAEAPFAPTSSYVTTLLPSASIDTSGEYIDTHRNNRFRVVNTLPGLTDEESYIWRDWMYFENDDQQDFGGPNKPYASVLHRPNGLQVGDTFVNSSATLQATFYEAVPFANVKAGKIITAFSNTIKTGSSETDNPYKNHATVIALEPGTILNGKATGGKIFVDFTERLQGSVSQISGNVLQGRRPIYTSRDTIGVDLNQDKWINLAFAQGQITETKKNELIADPRNLDRRLEVAIANGDTAGIANINQLKYWDSNGINILSSKQLLSDTTGAGDLSAAPGRQALVNKTKKSGDPGTAKVTTFGQWFTFEYSWIFPRLQVATVSMLTRGFRWLSDRITDEGTVNRVQSMDVATSELVMPVVTADTDRTVYAQAMLAGATIINAPGYALADVAVSTLPLFATAEFGAFVKSIKPDVFTVTALIKQPRISGIEEDEIVVYINHVDPILYLREDVIK